jgi:hypothetical protein
MLRAGSSCLGEKSEWVPVLQERNFLWNNNLGSHSIRHTGWSIREKAFWKMTA